MPNWCYNRITVFGDGEEKTTEQIKKIEKIFESKTPFNEFLPITTNVSNIFKVVTCKDSVCDSV